MKTLNEYLEDKDINKSKYVEYLIKRVMDKSIKKFNIYKKKIMKFLKLYEEYRHIKVWPSKSNVKDPNEPFFNEPKYNYKRKKEIFGTKDLSKDLIEIDRRVINDMLNEPNLNESLMFVLNGVKRKLKERINSGILNDEEYDYEPHIVFEELSDDDTIKLEELGFGVYIYDDSNGYSEDFGDKYRVTWLWEKN